MRDGVQGMVPEAVPVEDQRVLQGGLVLVRRAEECDRHLLERPGLFRRGERAAVQADLLCSLQWARQWVSFRRGVPTLLAIECPRIAGILVASRPVLPRDADPECCTQRVEGEAVMTVEHA